MSIKRSTLEKQLRSVTIKVTFLENGETKTEALTIQYKPFTIKSLNDVRQKTDEIAHQLAEFLVDVDMLEEDGSRCVPTVEFLESLDIEILRSIAEAVFGATSPNSKSVSSFGSGS